MRDPLDAGTAASLGALQGLTEFLPVSSSGHVAMGAWLFGIPDMPLALVVVLHAGTLIATLLVVGADVGRLALAVGRGVWSPKVFLREPDGRLALAIVVASLPTAAMGLVLEERVEDWSHVPAAVGACLLVSAIAVLSTRNAPGVRSPPQVGTDAPWIHAPSLWAALLIGIAQGCAVLPGVSRSGATIAAAMLLGMSASDAFRFSFLLSLPAIAGALMLQLSRPMAVAQLGAPALIGGLVALGTGYGALLVVRHTLLRGRFWAFALYLVPLGLALIAWDLAA